MQIKQDLVHWLIFSSENIQLNEKKKAFFKKHPTLAFCLSSTKEHMPATKETLTQIMRGSQHDVGKVRHVILESTHSLVS